MAPSVGILQLPVKPWNLKCIGATVFLLWITFKKNLKQQFLVSSLLAERTYSDNFLVSLLLQRQYVVSLDSTHPRDQSLSPSARANLVASVPLNWAASTASAEASRAA